MALFVRVVQAGSFAEAARRLGLPPTTMSRQVAQLEGTLQARLLHRTTRKLTLTDAGRTLFDQCASQIEALHSAGNDLAGGSQAPNGHVRIAAPVDFFNFFQMSWVKDFLAVHPGVQLDFVLSDAMADFIGEGIDVAFRGSAALPDSSLVARRVGITYLAMAASPAYLAARGTPSTVEELAQHDCIHAGGPGSRGTWGLNGPGGPMSIAVTSAFSANTGQAQHKAALAGLGICLLTVNTVQEDLRIGALVEVLPGISSGNAALYVVYPSRSYVPRAVTAFVEMAVERMSTKTDL